MATLAEELTAKAEQYFNSIPELEGQKPSAMLVDFVIEKFHQHRNYPSSFSEVQVDTDMRKHISTMAMAVVDIYAKSGAEGQTAHSENGVSRTYENAYISSSVFNDVLPFVKSL